MMARKVTDAQQAFIVRQSDEGASVTKICRKAGIGQAARLDRKKTYAGLLPTKMKRLKQLEDANGRLKKIAADRTFDRESLGL